jgi:hypothetical protein
MDAAVDVALGREVKQRARAVLGPRPRRRVAHLGMPPRTGSPVVVRMMDIECTED